MKKLFYFLAFLPLLIGCGEKPSGEPSEPVLPDDGSGQPSDVTPSGGDEQQGGDTTPDECGEQGDEGEGSGEGSGEGAIDLYLKGVLSYTNIAISQYIAQN